MVVVNLYAFEKTAAKPGVHFEELIENIDIGGPSMIRSAAKNFQDVAIVTSPADYDAIADEMQHNAGGPLPRNQMASRAKGLCHDRRLRFRHRLHARDASTPTATSTSPTPPEFPAHPAPLVPQNHGPALRRESAPESRDVLRRLRRGRRQRAANSRARNFPTTTSSTCKPPGTWRRNSTSPSAPSSSTPIPAAPPPARRLAEAYKRALECDPVSAFGGVIGVNRPIDADAAEEMAKLFLEVIAAPVASTRQPKQNSPPRKICAWSRSLTGPIRSGC